MCCLQHLLLSTYLYICRSRHIGLVTSTINVVFYFTSSDNHRGIASYLSCIATAEDVAATNDSLTIYSLGIAYGTASHPNLWVTCYNGCFTKTTAIEGIAYKSCIHIYRREVLACCAYGIGCQVSTSVDIVDICSSISSQGGDITNVNMYFSSNVTSLVISSKHIIYAPSSDIHISSSCGDIRLIATSIHIV